MKKKEHANKLHLIYRITLRYKSNINKDTNNTSSLGTIEEMT